MVAFLMTKCLLYDTLKLRGRMRYKVLRTEEFDDWLANESLESQVQIEKRISNIELEGHFGTIKDVRMISGN